MALKLSEWIFASQIFPSDLPYLIKMVTLIAQMPRNLGIDLDFFLSFKPHM